MLPIPKHLKDILVPMGEGNDEYCVSGVIRCLCGCESFRMKYFADVKEGIPYISVYKDNEALMIKTICNDCAKEYLIFDISKHGWNGFVCHDGLSVPDDELKPWQCPKCANSNLNMGIAIESNGKQDFIEETGIGDGKTDFSEDEWTEAFSSIGCELKCCGCGFSDDWTYETM